MKGVLLPVAGMVLLACGSAWADSKTVNLTLRIPVSYTHLTLPTNEFV